MNIINLIKKGESQTIEFKQSFADREKILKTICAFANTNGGKVFVGISDEGKIIGAIIGKDTLEKIPQKISENFDPVIFPSVYIEKTDNRNIIIIEVPEIYEKPVFFKNIAYKRVGRANRKISASEIRKIVKDTGGKTYWDEQICKGASIDDIDWNFIDRQFFPLYEETYKKKVIGNSQDIIESLGCLKKYKPTNAGILLFGKKPQRFFMNSYIALAKYKGQNIGIERLDYKEFSGNLFEQIDRCYSYIKENIAIMSKLLPYQIRRQDIPEYGLFSIRELVTNAVCHRDYYNQHTKVIIKIFSDRIEFYNPGGLPAEITPENITEKQYSRNPVIARVLAKIEYIEELGEGWNKIIDEHKNHPLKPEFPSIKSDKESVLVTVFSTKERFEEEKILELSERQKKALKYIKEHGRITNRDYRKLFSEISDRTVLSDLLDLVNKGILLKKGKTKGSYYIIPK